MSGILSIAVSGLNAAATRVANATKNIVNAASTNFIPQDIISLSNSAGSNNLGVTTRSVPRSVASVAATTTTTPITTVTSPIATTRVDLAANLPAQATTGFTSTVVPIQIYDSLGASHNVSLTFTKTSLNNWTANVTATDGAFPSGDYTATVPVAFNGGVNAGKLASIAPGANYTASGGQIQIALNYPGAGTQNLTLSLGTIGSSVNGVTQFADTNTAVTVSSVTQNGSAYNAAPLPTGATPLPATPDNGIDIAAELVSVLAARTDYGASAALIKTVRKLDQALLDITT
jgi:flagellar hook protein FlgE